MVIGGVVGFQGKTKLASAGNSDTILFTDTPKTTRNFIKKVKAHLWLRAFYRLGNLELEIKAHIHIFTNWPTNYRLGQLDSDYD